MRRYCKLRTHARGGVLRQQKPIGAGRQLQNRPLVPLPPYPPPPLPPPVHTRRASENRVPGPSSFAQRPATSAGFRLFRHYIFPSRKKLNKASNTNYILVFILIIIIIIAPGELLFTGWKKKTTFSIFSFFFYSDLRTWLRREKRNVHDTGNLPVSIL